MDYQLNGMKVEKKSEITYEDGSTIEELSWYKWRKRNKQLIKMMVHLNVPFGMRMEKDMEVYFDDNLNIIDEKHWNLDGSVKKELNEKTNS